MTETNKEDKKFAVDKYLDQVKILTALATALLISPNIVLMLRKSGIQNSQVLQVLEQSKKFLFIANISFLISIIMTYFVYSSVVVYLGFFF